MIQNPKILYIMSILSEQTMILKPFQPQKARNTHKKRAETV